MIYAFNNGRTNLLCTKLTSTTLGSKLDRGNLLWVGTDVRTPGPKIGSWTTHAVRGCGRQVVEAVDKYENLIFEMFLISGQHPNFQGLCIYNFDYGELRKLFPRVGAMSHIGYSLWLCTFTLSKCSILDRL